MSASAEPTEMERLNLAELVTRIERMNAETHKFVEEAAKLAAETRKLGRDRWLAPFLTGASLGLALGSLLLAYAALQHH
jgi:hypothetical protein